MPQPRDPAPAHAWIEIDLGALERNARRLAAHVAPARLLPMVKADGYGLGAVEIARALLPIAPYAFGVATAGEGVALRAAGIEARIIVFSPWAAADAPRCVAHRLDAAVLSLDSLRTLAESAPPAGGRLDLHLEIDTGMGRAGLAAAEAETWAGEVAEILSREGLALASAYTHFHSSDSDADATRRQMERFRAALGTLGETGVTVPLTHTANSDAVGHDRLYHLDLVRPGIYLYGGRRATGIGGALPPPEPVVHVRARVLEARRLAPDSTLSYGARYVTRGHETIATLGIGYADGLSWRLSNRGTAVVRGHRVPIRGAVCMDVTTVDVSRVPGVQAGDTATLLGVDGGAEIMPDEMAEMDQSIVYEVLTRFGRRLPRVYLGRDRPSSTE